MTAAPSTPLFTGVPWVTTTVPVNSPVPPAVYTPPPPEPVRTVLLSKCPLCLGLFQPGDQGGHEIWHRTLGLHGAFCGKAIAERAIVDAIVSGSEVPEQRPCTCGLQPG